MRTLDKVNSLFPSFLLVALTLLPAPHLLAQSEVPPDDVSQESVKFAQIYSVLEQNYVDAVDPDKIILEGAVRGMLSQLDPFSSFFNPDQFQMLEDQTRGQSLGFGSILYVQPGRVVVLQTAENSPAGRAGLGPGDEIVSVNGTRIARLDFDSLIQFLQQSRSQPVSLGVIHPGKLVPQEFKLSPAEVALPTVDKAFILSAGIGYVHITGFELKTPEEVSDAINRLGGAGLKGVLLDVRDNHGGMVDAAVTTASLFLNPDQVLLTVKGRTVPAKAYRTLAAPEHFAMPLIVLVNGNTASAAEILAAGLEEHDRALVVGEPTFGKGVVQNVFPLSNKSGLALTTAQYFTASGRSIQRPLPGTALAGEMESSLSEGETKSSRTGSTTHTVSPARPAGNILAFHTDAGRTISAGGGIMPDVAIPGSALDPWVTFLNQRGFFTSFASEFLTLHGRIDRSFEPDAKAAGDFRDFLSRQGIRTPEEFWAKDQDYLKLRIETEVLNLVFGLAAGEEFEVKVDPQVQKASQLFSTIPALLKAPGLKADNSRVTPPQK